MSKGAWWAGHIALAVSALGVAPEGGRAQSLSYVGGLQYATGSFIFTQRTWTASLANGLSWSAARLRVSASVPLVMQPTGWLQYSGTGMMVPTGGIAGSGGPSRDSSRTGRGMHGSTMTPSSDMAFSSVGFGDPIGRIEAAIVQGDGERQTVSLVGAAKAPVAKVSTGFGTGKWDVGAGLASAVHVASMSVFAEAVYWKLGNPPGATLRNAVAFALSVGRVLPRSPLSVLGSVSGASSLSAGLEAPVQAGIGAGYLLESGSSLFVTAAAGLTRTAPAVSAGLGWRIPLGRER